MAPWCLHREERKNKEKERGRERRKKGRRKLHAYCLFLSTADTLITHITQTVTVLSCKTFNPEVEARSGV